VSALEAGASADVSGGGERLVRRVEGEGKGGKDEGTLVMKGRKGRGGEVEG